MPFMIPLLAALVVIMAARGMSGDGVAGLTGSVPPSVPTMGVGGLLAVASSAAAFIALDALVGVLSRRWRSLTWMLWWDGLAITAGLGLFSWWCLGLGLVGALPGRALPLLAFVGLLLVHWWIHVRALHGQRGGREPAWPYVWERARLAILPVLFIIGGFDLVLWGIVGSGMAEWSIPDTWWAVLVGVGTMGMLLALLAAIGPVVLRVCLRLRPIEDTEQVASFRALAQSMGVRVRGFLAWPVIADRLLGALSMGLVPRWRYVVLTPPLLKQLKGEELLAVVGHELGHFRHGHVLLYVCFLFALSVWLQVVMTPLTPMIEHSFLAGLIGATFAILLANVVLTVGGFWLCFGVISRQCERQADLAGARAVGHVQPMQRALRRVANGLGIDLERPDWLHGSIASRIAYLDRAQADPGLVPAEARRVRGLWVMVLALLVVGVTLHAIMGAGTVANQAGTAPADALTPVVAGWLLWWQGVASDPAGQATGPGMAQKETPACTPVCC